jgi:hypothetical protein
VFRLFVSLDLAFVENRSEGFAAAFVKADCEFGSFAALVFLAYHLPRLCRSNFLLTLRTFCHSVPGFQC